MKTFPLDHFGAASNLAVKTLLDAKRNRKERLRAFRTLKDLARISGEIDFFPVYIGINCDLAGGLCLVFAKAEDEPSPTHIPSFQENPS